MHIAVGKETRTGEHRVALTPHAAAKLIGDGHTVAVETAAGSAAGINDVDYVKAGVTMAASRAELNSHAELMVLVNRPHIDELVGLAPGTILVALLDPLWTPNPLKALAAAQLTSLSLELVPRITRAQSMDVLSSMATVAGYQAVLTAAHRLPRMFPLLMTAGGTVPAARVLVLGAGVAGLQAIATSRRLGAVVEAYDVRPAAAEQIKSLGAKVVELDLDTSGAEDAGGYARAQTDDSQARQQSALTPFVAASDVIITTAAIPGAASPELLTQTMVEAMRPGSLIVDLAAERGGNCALTKADTEVDHNAVTILGPTQLESGSARSASLLYANNLVTFIRHLTQQLDPVGDGAGFADEILGPMLITHHGVIVNDRVLEKIGREPS